MKRSILFIALGLLNGSLMAAPMDDVRNAVQKLRDAGNYSWKTTFIMAGNGGEGGRGRGGFGGGPREGKTSKDGYTVITSIPSPYELVEKLIRTSDGFKVIRSTDENAFETVIKGDKSVTLTQDGWQTPVEMAAARGAGCGGRGSFGGASTFLNTIPATQVEDLLGKVKEIKSAEGVYSGDLTEDGAKSLLTSGVVRAGDNGPEISGAKGSVKIWIKGGVLSNCEIKVQATLSFNGNDVAINRTITTEIKDVGTTKVEVREEAKKKVS